MIVVLWSVPAFRLRRRAGHPPLAARSLASACPLFETGKGMESLVDPIPFQPLR
jgi:hypothetical protein